VTERKNEKRKEKTPQIDTKDSRVQVNMGERKTHGQIIVCKE